MWSGSSGDKLVWKSSTSKKLDKIIKELKEINGTLKAMASKEMNFNYV